MGLILTISFAISCQDARHELESIKITPANETHQLSTTGYIDYKATGVYSDDDTEDLTDKVTWKTENFDKSSSTTTILSSEVKGRVFLSKGGTFSIIATYDKSDSSSYYSTDDGDTEIRGDTVLTINDSIAPSTPTNFSASDTGDNDNQIVLNWNNPGDSDFSAVVIRRDTSDYPSSTTSGTSVYTGTASTYTDASSDSRQMTNGTTYYYSIFAKDTYGNVSSRAIASGTP